MNIIYDISVLGAAHISQTHRGGISRVIGELLNKLIDNNECRIYFSAYNDPSQMVGALHYLAAHPSLGNNKFCFTNNTMMNLVTRIAQRIHPTAPSTKIAKITQRLETMLLHGLAPLYRSLDSKILEQTDIFHSTFYYLPGYVHSSPRLRRFITIYDMLPILFPRHFPTSTDKIFNNILRSIHPDDWVLAISQSTKDDFCSYLNHDPARVVVTRLAASNKFYQFIDSTKNAKIRKTYNIPDGQYILSLCTFEPRKNIDHAIRCFVRTIREQHINDLNLVLVGAKGWQYDKIFYELSHESDMQNRIIVTGYVPDEDLAAVYSGALVFIYPTLYEGFGLPPLEAMQCGVPVITSNTSSLPEVVGDAGIMVDPRDSDALCQSILNIYLNSSLRQDLAQRSLERAKLFSWDKCAAETIAAYKTALRGSS